MAGSARLADAGFLVALLDRDDRHHRWAAEAARRHPPPWATCDAVLSEVFYLLGRDGTRQCADLVRRGGVVLSFGLAAQIDTVLALMDKYADVPMSLADACLVRMTEVLPDPVVLSTDSDFRVYRRHGRQIVPSVLPD